MKKRIILIIIILLVTILISILGLYYYNKIKVENRYNEIKEDISKELERYLYVVAPRCSTNSSMLIDEKTLIYNAGMDKEKFLDIDKKSYCKVYVKTKCNKDNKWNYEINLSCKDYEDEGYNFEK